MHATFSPTRIAKEIEILKLLGGKHFVVPLLSGFRLEDNISLIFPYFPHKPFREYYLLMDEEEVKEYLKVQSFFLCIKKSDLVSVTFSRALSWPHSQRH